MKKILITGANSYIGCSFRQYAMQHYAADFSIDTMDVRGDAWRQKDFKGYDCILHVAGIAHADVGRVSEKEKEAYYQVNTNLAIAVAEKAKAEGVGQFILMSSMIIYGGAKRITKEIEPKPSNFYGDSKWQADQAIRALAAENFAVTVLRPPMVYGKGCKGNYQVIAKYARTAPIFPEVMNERSMLYIENLCEFLCVVIKEQRAGIFFPQNKELVNTCEMVKEIAKVNGHQLCTISWLKPFVAIGRKMPGKIGELCQKAFGSSYYELEMSEYDFEYRVVDFQESVRRTEEKVRDRE